MIKEKSIKELLYSLINSEYPRTQMDIFYQGQVIMQIYNQSDVKKWDVDLPITLSENGGVVMDLTFTKGKINNSENFKRFLESPFFDEFISSREKSIQSYFSSISNPFSLDTLAKKVTDIIFTVYEIKSPEKIEVFVRAF